MWPFKINLDKKRLQLLENTHSKIMREFYSTPFPAHNCVLNEVNITAFDVETTGLNPETDNILSIGLVNINNFSIVINTCWHQIIKVSENIPESSAVIHQITDDQAAGGLELDQAIPILLNKIKGSVLLVHNASIEKHFMDRVCRRLYHTPFIIPMIDTRALAQRQFERRDQPIKENSLRLFNLRETYNLPRYKAHNALNDALATAELFLALSSAIYPDNNGKLKEFLI